MFIDKPVKLSRTNLITESVWVATEAFLKALKNLLLFNLLDQEIDNRILDRFQLRVRFLKTATTEEERGTQTTNARYTFKLVKITVMVSDTTRKKTTATGWISLNSDADSGDPIWETFLGRHFIEIEGKKFEIDFNPNFTFQPKMQHLECDFSEVAWLDKIDFTPLK